jgi:hypothetical protein
MMQTRSSSSEGEVPSVAGQPTHETRAYWTPKDEAFLIAFLSEKTGVTSNNTFKDTVVKEAAVALESCRTRGVPKTLALCKSKWMRLKKTFDTVTQLKLKSGFSWTNEKGMGVEDEKDPAWAALVEVCERVSSTSMTSNCY